MTVIVQQFIKEMGKSVEKLLSEAVLCDIDQLSLDLLEVSKEQICILLSEFLNLLNKKFREDKSFRKEAGLVLKEKDRERSIMLSTGIVRFTRDYYMQKATGEYAYPIDILAGIAPYSRISEHLCAALLNRASEHSYEKSAGIVTGGEVSKQTVKNKLMSVGRLEKRAPEAKRKVKELQVLADEDHVHLQNGKNQMVPLITICEGIEKVREGRNELKNPVHFKGDIKDIESTWEKVAGYIYESYEEDELERINLHGDGAPWIKKGVEELPNCRHIMDAFHFEKYLKSATAGFPGKNYRYYIRESILSKDMYRALAIVSEMQKSCVDKKQEKRIKRFRTYLKNNWSSIVLRYTEEDIMGSCTEALISHVYSARLSRHPMGWSEEGLDRIAELRVYVMNGCKVTREDFRRSKEEKQGSILLEYSRKRFEEIRESIDWSVFERELYIPATHTATQILIRSIGKMRDIA